MTTMPTWEAKRTDETRMVEDALGNEFERVDSYRHNSASIRVRVVDSRFDAMSRDERERRDEDRIGRLPEGTQQDIVTIVCFAPAELQKARPRKLFGNIC
ncbi:hypothetical protein ACYOEI_07075 [Singulisphaera rosea]